MAEWWRVRFLLALGVAGTLSAGAALATQPPGAAGGGASAAAPALPPTPAPRWLPAMRIEGRLRAADIGLVINRADPYSVAVGEYYIKRRGLARWQVLRVTLPAAPVLGLEDFERLRAAIEERFDGRVQALALAWQAPFAVDCNSITGALTLGFDGALCANSCGASKPSRYFNTPTARPFRDLGLRPTMLLAAPDVAQAKALIDRGVAADGTLAPSLRERPTAQALLLTTADAARSVRRFLYPPPGPIGSSGVEVRVQDDARWTAVPNLLLVSTGSATVAFEPKPDWLPGGLGDHLTSYGGSLSGLVHGQTTAMDWIASGATASHGSVSEPCNHLQKFPHPQLLLHHYLQGATVIEAYWKSVFWPQQSLFVGEPLAAPFAPPSPPSAPATAR